MNQRKNNNGVFWGSVLVLIGILFLMDNFYILDFGNLVSTFWPVILIVIGIKMLMDRKKTRTRENGNYSVGPSEKADESFDLENSLSESNVFGDVVLNIKSDKFTGGSVNNVFGDIKIDLSEAKADSDIVKLFTSGVFGDITIIAPAGFALRVSASCVAGDLTIKGMKKDGLFPNMTYQDENYEQSAQKMNIQTSLVFGSINIY